MTATTAMEPALRHAAYLAQTGRRDLTPAQRRRLAHKVRRGMQRTGRTLHAAWGAKGSSIREVA